MSKQRFVHKKYDHIKTDDPLAVIDNWEADLLKSIKEKMSDVDVSQIEEMYVNFTVTLIPYDNKSTG